MKLLHVLSGMGYPEGKIPLSEETEHSEEISGPLSGQGGKEEG